MAAVPSIGRASLVEAPSRSPQAAATEGLYERHSTKILSYCLHQLGSREEAEDAVQTTFMNAFRALGRGVVPESESAWLFKIAENVCLSRRRSSWRRGRIESPSDFEVIEEIIPGPSRQRDELIGIEDALASMPEQQRRAILLREWQGLSYREIADELEVSQSAVETLIFRARRSLAQGLEQPELQKQPKRRGFRRALHIVDLGTIVAAAKTLLAGSAAVKATAAAVAVTAAAGTAASVTPKIEGHSPKAAAPLVAEATPVAAEPRTSAPAVVQPAAELVPRQRPALVTPARSALKAKVAKAKPPVRTRPVAAAPKPAPAPPAPVEPAVAETPTPAPVEPARSQRPDKPKPSGAQQQGKGGGKGKSNGNGRPAEPEPEPTPVVPVVTPVVDAAEAPQEPKEQRGKHNRELAAVTAVEPVAADEEQAEEPAPSAEGTTVVEAVDGEKLRGRRK